MKRAIFLSSLAALVLSSSVLTSAQAQDTAPPEPPTFRRAGPRPVPVRPRPQLKEELGLTDAQQTDIRKALEGARREQLRRSTDLKIARLDLRSLLREEKVDEKAVAARLAEASAAQTALLKLRVDTALAMKRILSAEQQKKLAELKADRGQGRALRLHRRGMPSRGLGPGGRGTGPVGPGDGFDSDIDLDFDVDTGHQTR